MKIADRSIGMLMRRTILFAFRRLVWTMAMVCAGSAPGHAQTLPDQDIMSFSLEELAKTKVYTASRHLEDSREAPSAVTLISAEEIRVYGWRTLADVLRSVRGFHTAYDRDYTYLGVRGFLRSGDYNSRFLLLINGHRVNDNVYDSAQVGTEFPLDLNLIDHIEIVRGPSSSLFGTNAVFGVINVITRRAHPGIAVEVAGDTSSFLGRSGQLTATLQRGQVSGLVSGSLYRAAGHEDLFFPEFAMSEINRGIAHNIDGDGFGHGFADFQVASFRIQGLYSRRSKLIPTAPYDTVFNDPTDRSVDTRAYVDTSYHRSILANTDLDVRTYYDSYKSEGYGAFDNRSLGRFTGVTTGRANWIGTEGNIGIRAGRHRFTVGADYEYSFDIDQLNYAIGQAPILDSHRTLGMAAAYGEAELNLFPKVSIHGGGRLDWFDAFGTALSPRVAVVYSPTSRTAVKYIFGRAFRAPNAYESYYEDGFVIMAPTVPLKPENIQSHEVVLERSLASWLLVTAGGFYDHVENLIDQRPDPVSGLTHFVNHGRDRSRGLEFELQAKRASGWSGRASYTFAKSQDELVRQSLANSPSHLAKLNGAAPLGSRATFGAELLFSSAEESYQETRVGSWLLTNVTLATKSMWGGWEFSASCYNLLDRRWASPAGPELKLAEVPQDGRAYGVRMQYRFHRERTK
ncbi:MAG TPA: TonB-dependent receptor [Terriglobales bacterium]|nr:TonB-dependent receptor [Terriglobales bacterium]